MQNKFIKKLFLPIVIVLLVLGVIFAYQAMTTKPAEFVGQKKSPHFLDSTPLHGETYAAQPINITLNFDFDLALGSSVSVKKDSSEWTIGEVRIENNKTALKKELKQGMSDGEYIVNYSACWPDKSCHEGSFSFKIDSKLKSEFLDMKGKSEVTIDMKEIKFVSQKVLISPGTKVTWINSDQVEHFVNTETHPAHTYFTSQNSRGLAKGQTYSTTFIKLGQYNYHCSAHASSMIGSIVVLN